MRESLATYDFELVDDHDMKVKYEMSDEFDNRFLVVFKNDSMGPSSKPVLGKSYELTYFVFDEDEGRWSVDKIVQTNVWVLMRTIFGKILEDFIGDRPWVHTIRLEGQPKQGEAGITQRTKLYLRHLENNPVPRFRVDNHGNNRINLVKKV